MYNTKRFRLCAYVNSLICINFEVFFHLNIKISPLFTRIPKLPILVECIFQLYTKIVVDPEKICLIDKNRHRNSQTIFNIIDLCQWTKLTNVTSFKLTELVVVWPLLYSVSPVSTVVPRRTFLFAHRRDSYTWDSRVYSDWSKIHQTVSACVLDLPAPEIHDIQHFNIFF